MNRLFARFTAAVCLLLASAALGAPRRILYVTATYGFRHTDSIDASVEVMQQLARESGVLEIVHTEDVSLLTADYLRAFDAVYFFTSGELPLSDQQKTDLLEFVRQGKDISQMTTYGARHHLAGKCRTAVLPMTARR